MHRGKQTQSFSITELFPQSSRSFLFSATLCSFVTFVALLCAEPNVVVFTGFSRIYNKLLSVDSYLKTMNNVNEMLEDIKLTETECRYKHISIFMIFRGS